VGWLHWGVNDDDAYHRRADFWARTADSATGMPGRRRQKAGEAPVAVHSFCSRIDDQYVRRSLQLDAAQPEHDLTVW
jgi:hypothetical protein